MGKDVASSQVRLVSMADPTAGTLSSAQDTGADGRCTFAGLFAGSYQLEVLSHGLAVTWQMVTLAGSSASADISLTASKVLGGCISGPGGPLAGVQVELGSPAKGVILATTSDDQGNYSFDSVPSGTFGCHRQIVMSGLRQVRMSAFLVARRADERGSDRDESTGTGSA
jgi:hypothetical protein